VTLFTISVFDDVLWNNSDDGPSVCSCCQDMRSELRERTASLEYINHAGQDLVSKASAEQSSQRLKTDLENLNARWKKVLSEIDDRHSKFTGATEQLKHLRVTSVI